ncbi:MAG: pentapeptide repeat-containing protein, partial [Proteobacteria bacterium]|nr:pentapeptide repeat-containing protein [Pseudomonadota bacterium]
MKIPTHTKYMVLLTAGLCLTRCGQDRHANTIESSDKMTGLSEEIQFITSKAARAQMLRLTEDTKSTSTTLIAPPEFRYDRVSGACKNPQGKVGYNTAYLGECGDLHSQDLSGKDLRGMNLRGANLAETVLKKADLSETDLRGADLWKVNWDGTLFTGAIFYEKTRLPFELQTAKDLGMVALPYTQLDAWFINVLEAWQASAESRIPSQLVDTLFLGADFAPRSEAIIGVTAAKKSIPLFDLMQSYGFSYYDTNQTPFFARVLVTGDEAFIKGIVTHGFDVNRFAPTKTALLLAIESNQLRFVKWILDFGGNVDIGTKSGQPPVYFALANGFRPAVLELIERGAKVDQPTPEGFSLIDLASDLELMKILQDKGADAKKVKIYGRRNLDEIRWLKDLGADLDMIDSDNESLLLKVIARFTPLDKPLLDYLLGQKVNVGRLNRNGIGIYGFAFRSGQRQELMKFFIDNHFPPLGRVSDGQNGYLSFMKLIAEQFPNDFMDLARLITTPVPSDASMFVSAYAIGRRHLASLDKDLRELKSLGLFVPSGQSGLILPLILDGADVLTRIKLLQELGVDLNAAVTDLNGTGTGTNLLGNVVAHGSLNQDKMALIKLLIEHGIKAERVDVKGKNALFYFPEFLPEGLEAQYSELATLLINAGAKTDLFDADGGSLTSRYLKLCNEYDSGGGDPVRHGQVAFLKLLIKNGAPTLHIWRNHWYPRDSLADALFSGYFNKGCHQKLIAEFESELRPVLSVSPPAQTAVFQYSYLQAENWRRWYSLPAASAHKPLVDAFHKMLELGMDPSKFENPEISAYTQSTMESLHALGLVDLIKELVAKGAQSMRFTRPKIDKFTLPLNGCDPFSGIGQKADLGGCLLPNNTLWSMPSTEDHCGMVAGPTGNEYRCTTEGATGLMTFDGSTQLRRTQDYCQYKVKQGGMLYGWDIPSYRDAVSAFIAGHFQKLSTKQEYMVVQRFTANSG